MAVQVEKQTVVHVVEAPPPPDEGKVAAAVAKGRSVAEAADKLADDIDAVLAENREALAHYVQRPGQ